MRRKILFCLLALVLPPLLFNASAQAASRADFNGCWEERGEARGPSGVQEIRSRVVYDLETPSSLSKTLPTGPEAGGLVVLNIYTEARFEPASQTLTLLKNGDVIQHMRLNADGTMLITRPKAQTPVEIRGGRCQGPEDAAFAALASSYDHFAGFWMLDGQPTPLLTFNPGKNQLTFLGRGLADRLGRKPITLQTYMEVARQGSPAVHIFAFAGPAGEPCQITLSAPTGPGEPAWLMMTVNKEPVANNRLTIMKR